MRRRTALFLAITAGFLAGCERKVVIGVVLPETGPSAVYGASIKSGFQLALDANPVPAAAGAELLYRDSASDPARAVAAAEAVIDRGARLVVGGVTTAEARAMIAVADRRETVLLSPSASAPDLSRKSEFFFRLYPSDELEGVDAADFLAVRDQPDRVLVIQEDNDYTRGLVPVFVAELANRGGEIVASARFDDRNWADEVRRAIAAHHPTAVYVCGYGDAIVGALRVLQAVRYAGTVCTTSAINTAELIRRAAVFDGEVFFPLVSLDEATASEPGRSFVRRYREAYNLAPDIYAACGYDAALLALAVVRSQARTGPEIRHFLHTMSPLTGVTGELAFDEFGNVTHTPHMHRLFHGMVERVHVDAPSGEGRAADGSSPEVKGESRE
jgi:branched-chain amino acid transport system substrate-binding protein